MATAFLHAELTNLAQEAKRRNSDLRHAAEDSLRDLKSISSASDVATELSRRPSFLLPFFIACSTRNSKFTTIAVACLQRLIVSKALAKTKLREVLEAFREAANLGVDIQLKILQALPPLLQNYAEDLHGPLLAEALLICAALQGSKMGVVNNTAAATLSQIVITVFDKVVVEDGKALEIPAIGQAPSATGDIPVRAASLDAYNVFNDLCLLTEGQKPNFLRFSSLPQAFGLEVVESVLTNHPDVFLSHPEQAYILRTRVAPLVIRSLSERLNFPTTVRVIRVLYILLRRHLSILTAECEVSLGLLMHLLELDPTQPWKRVLCLEVLKGLCTESALLRTIFAHYDASPGGKPIVRELMGAMTRLATEKPSIIGLGSQSSTPFSQQLQKDTSSEQAALEAGGVAGIIGGAVGVEVNTVGLGAWSMVRVSCIDQLDKSEPPPLPESYTYYLTLMCINNFLEGLAKLVLPLSSGDGSKRRATRLVPPGAGPAGSDTESTTLHARPVTPDIPSSPVRQMSRKKRSQRMLINPLTLDSHPMHADIVMASAMVEACWPAILASCSTFLYATLDNELYHSLVRAFQKFTHVAGVMRLATPRDAFLTTLGKAAVPSNILSASLIPTHSSSITTASDSLFSNARGLLGVDGTTSDRSASASDSHAMASLNIRNLLCLRALLNLGIALGPTLESSWTIILETLQQADYVLFASSRRSGRQLSLSGPMARTDPPKATDPSSLSNIGPELAAVESAAAKMFDSTKDFPDDAFVSVLLALCGLLTHEDQASGRVSTDEPRSPAPLPPTSPGSHRRKASVPTTPLATSQAISDNAFALDKLCELSLINMNRLIGPNPAASGWNILINELIHVTASREPSNNLRFKAAEVLCEVVVATAKTATSDNTENLGGAQKRVLSALKITIESKGQIGPSESVMRTIDLEIHRLCLEALNAILEHIGQSLSAGWEIAFEIITSIFNSSTTDQPNNIPASPGPGLPVAASELRTSKGVKLTRSSFSSLELICSDFLGSLPTSCVLVLVDALFAFCSQQDDLNISLTTVTFFWNVSAFLQSKTEGEVSDESPKPAGHADSEQGLLRMVENQGSGTYAALWLLLLLRLTGVSNDPRAEVRNGSIQTLFRIFDTYGHQLGPRGWSSCLEIVVFKMMNITPENIDTASQSDPIGRKQWDDTIRLVLGGIGTLYSNYLDIFVQQQNFRHTWSVFVRYLQVLLRWHSFEVRTGIFEVFSRVLDRVDSPSKLTSESRREVWELWSAQGVELVDDLEETGNGTQETLKAYVDAFRSLYRLLEPNLTANIIQKALGRLEACVLFPNGPPYFLDIDTLTPLQSSVMEAIGAIRTDVIGAPSLVLKELAVLATVAYKEPQVTKGKNKTPTYVALSTRSMSTLREVAIKHIGDTEIYGNSAIPMALSALETPITLKYNFIPNATPSAKRPSQWRHATETFFAISKEMLPILGKLPIPDNIIQEIWKRIVSIVGSIVRARDTTNVDEITLRQDEKFDVEIFHQLRDLIIPALGDAVVPEPVAMQYVEAVFQCSMLYEIPGESAVKNDAWPGVEAYGSTGDLILERRSTMSYVCIDELFALVATSEDNRPQVRRLAEIVAPWLIRRVALVLESYVADQPLRGRIPQPICQRKEMLYVLKGITQLESAAHSVHIDAPSIPTSAKRHLFKLFPLFTRCIAVAQGDHEVLQLLSQGLDEMGGALGL